MFDFQPDFLSTYDAAQAHVLRVRYWLPKVGKKRYTYTYVCASRTGVCSQCNPQTKSSVRRRRRVFQNWIIPLRFFIFLLGFAILNAIIYFEFHNAHLLFSCFLSTFSPGWFLLAPNTQMCWIPPALIPILYRRAWCDLLTHTMRFVEADRLRKMWNKFLLIQTYELCATHCKAQELWNSKGKYFINKCVRWWCVRVFVQRARKNSTFGRYIDYHNRFRLIFGVCNIYFFRVATLWVFPPLCMCASHFGLMPGKVFSLSFWELIQFNWLILTQSVLSHCLGWHRLHFRVGKYTSWLRGA